MGSIKCSTSEFAANDCYRSRSIETFNARF